MGEHGQIDNLDDRQAQKRIARFEKIDAMPPEMKELVHFYGFHVVNSFMGLGVTKPRHIRHLVECVLDEFSPTRGTFSSQGVRVLINRDQEETSSS